MQIEGILDANQVWLRRSGNDLELSIIGTADMVTISEWYTSPDNQIETFVLGNGRVLGVGSVQTLVNAMASFAPPSPGQTVLPANYQSALNNVIAASWA